MLRTLCMRPRPETIMRTGETKPMAIGRLVTELGQILDGLAGAIADPAADPESAKAAPSMARVHKALIRAWELGALGTPLFTIPGKTEWTIGIPDPDGTGWTIRLGPGQTTAEDGAKEANG